MAEVGELCSLPMEAPSPMGIREKVDIVVGIVVKHTVMGEEGIGVVD